MKKSNPLPHRERRTEPPPVAFTQDELKRLFAAIKKSKRDRAIFYTAYLHGLRASEIGLLQIADLDLKRGRISIQRLKGSYSGIHPMKPALVRLIRSYLRTRKDQSDYLFISNRGLPISRFQLDKLMKLYGKAAGVPRKKQKFHALKHSIGTHLAEAGEDLKAIQDWLGHVNISNTAIYTRVTNPARDQRARRFFSSNRIV